jgi:hypothetical protein
MLPDSGALSGRRFARHGAAHGLRYLGRKAMGGSTRRSSFPVNRIGELFVVTGGNHGSDNLTVACATRFGPLLYGRSVAFGSGGASSASRLMTDAGSHRVGNAVDVSVPGAAAALPSSTDPVAERTLGSAIGTADLTLTARLSERRFSTGNREWVSCELIAFITGWFVLFFVR